MIYITGDCHADYERFGFSAFPEQREMTKEDYVIICGDFGYLGRTREQDYWLRWLNDRPFTTLWVDGNHENFDALKEYEPSAWRGGKVQFLKDSVIHLMRGQIYEIGGRTWFTFGGARSHDIEDGILDPKDPMFKKKKQSLNRRGARYRIRHVDWWEEEMPSRAEMEEGLRNLEAAGNAVDYIVTHCAPTGIQSLLPDGEYVPDSLTDYFERLREKIRFRNWFFGHYHDNRIIEKRFALLYEQIVRVL